MIEITFLIPTQRGKLGSLTKYKKEFSVASEIYFAVAHLGYDMNQTTVAVDLCRSTDTSRLFVTLNGEYFGVWDVDRKTFVD